MAHMSSHVGDVTSNHHAWGTRVGTSFTRGGLLAGTAGGPVGTGTNEDSFAFPLSFPFACALVLDPTTVFCGGRATARSSDSM